MDETKIWEMIDQFIHLRVSDIYLIPLRQRYRLLILHRGQLQHYDFFSRPLAIQIITYFKYHADMAVAEHRRPQAGSLRDYKRKVDLRISTVGDFLGNETMVIRLIYPLGEHYQMLCPDQWPNLITMSAKRGMILFSGPMGSGKTTTMYRLANQFSAKEVVLTIEDPVEIYAPNFIQLQVNDLAGMSYHDLLRLGLRHRPGVFIIGEIRDSKTAKIAIQAALSGHLVLATIHAQSAVGVLMRLRQLGIPKDQLGQAITGVCYQRLVQTLHGDCAVLMDQLAGDELIDVITEEKWGGVSHDWQARLANALANQQITSEECSRLQKG